MIKIQKNHFQSLLINENMKKIYIIGLVIIYLLTISITMILYSYSVLQIVNQILMQYSLINIMIMILILLSMLIGLIIIMMIYRNQTNEEVTLIMIFGISAVFPVLSFFIFYFSKICYFLFFH